MKKIVQLTLISSFIVSTTQLQAQNVGINTDGSAPTMMLHVKVATGDDGIRIQNNSGTGDALINLQDGTSSEWTFGLDASNGNRFVFDNGGALSLTNVLVLETGGDVGIGVNDPTAQLTVSEDAIFNESGGANSFRVESDNFTNAINVNAATDQIGFFINNSPFAGVEMELSANDPTFPVARFVNTNATGTTFLGVGQNDPTNGFFIPGAGVAGSSVNVSGVSGYATTSGVEAFGGYFENDGVFSNVGGWQLVAGVWTARKILGNGTVSTIVNTPEGDKVAMACPEAPEIVFQDFGTGQLQNGQAHINLDPILTNNIHVDKDHPLKVYITLEGDCQGVFVSNKSASGFDVTELAGGSSNASFSWMVVANRADMEVQYSDGTTKTSKNSDSRFAPVNDYVKPGRLNPEDKERYMIDYVSKAVNK